MRSLDHLEMKYAAGGRVSTPHALAAVRRAMEHLKRGDHRSAHAAALLASPDAMAHPMVQHALPIIQAGYADGGSVNEPGVRTSSPGSPGISGAIKDAVSAVQNYVEAGRREIAADKQKYVDAAVENKLPGQRETVARDEYGDGGKVDLMKSVIKAMTDHIVNNQNIQAAKPITSQFRKSPAQLAQELRAGFVPPSDFNHLLYTDPALTPLINRYQSGIDNQNLTAAQKQALIEKLSQMGGHPVPPQLPPSALNPQQTDAILTGAQQ